MRKLMCGFLVVLAVLSFGQTVRADFTNASFDDPDQTSYGTCIPSVPTDWTAVGTDVYADSEAEFAPETGPQDVQIWAGSRIWQNSGVAMVADTSYVISVRAGVWVTGGTYVVTINAANNTSSEGTVVATGTFDNAFATRWDTKTFWYTCDASHAGKYLSVSLNGSGDGITPDYRIVQYDNVSLSTFTGPTPTPIPSPTPGLWNGSFESPVIDVAVTNIDADYWNVIYRDGYGIDSTPNGANWVAPAPDGVQFIEEGSPETYVWQNTKVAMQEGTTYIVTASSARAGEGGNAYLMMLAADDDASLGGAPPLLWEQAVASLGIQDPVNSVWFNGRTLSYTCDAAHAGKYLVVAVNGIPQYVFWDNITLSYVYPVNAAVSLGDYDPVDWGVPIGLKVELYDGDGNWIQTTNFLKEFDYSMDIYSPGVPPGHYFLAVKSYIHLRKVVEFEKLENAPLTLDPIELANGDLHGDNEVGTTSLSIVLGRLGWVGD